MCDTSESIRTSSVVAPCEIAHNSLPVGVLLTGNKLSDYELLEAAKIIEAHTNPYASSIHPNPHRNSGV